MTVTFSFKGGRELERAFEGLGEPRDLRRLGLAALKKGAKPIVDEQKRLAPKDQHDLERSIKVGQAIKGYRARPVNGRVVTYIGIDDSLDRRLHIYAEAQETGRRNMAAHPYFRPGFDNKAQEAIDKVAVDLWIGIDKRARRLGR